MTAIRVAVETDYEIASLKDELQQLMARIAVSGEDRAALDERLGLQARIVALESYIERLRRDKLA